MPITKNIFQKILESGMKGVDQEMLREIINSLEESGYSSEKIARITKGDKAELEAFRQKEVDRIEKIGKPGYDHLGNLITGQNSTEKTSLLAVPENQSDDGDWKSMYEMDPGEQMRRGPRPRFA